MKPEKVKLSHWWQYNLLFFMEHMIGAKSFKKWFGNIEHTLFMKIDHYAANSLKKPDFKIVSFEANNQNNIKYPLKYPTVFRGAAAQWKCTKNWSIDFFAENYGDIEVTLFRNQGLYDKQTNQDFDAILLKDYIAELKIGSKKYLKFSRLIQDNPELHNGFDTKWLESFQPRGSFSKIFYTFMGAKGTLTPIHNGFQPTVFVQIAGQKKWTFYCTGDRLFLGVRPTRMNYWYSDANPNENTNENFPLLKHAIKHEIILNPGDVLYFPSFVWHQVENLTDSIGAAYKFVHLPSAYKSSKMMTLLFFLATKPFLLSSFFSSRLKKVDPVFVKK
jgi:hypothetical protein